MNVRVRCFSSGSVRLLPLGPHVELDLRDPCGIRGRLLARVTAAADVGLRCTSDLVYQNMVLRYRV